MQEIYMYILVATLCIATVVCLIYAIRFRKLYNYVQKENHGLEEEKRNLSTLYSRLQQSEHGKDNRIVDLKAALAQKDNELSNNTATISDLNSELSQRNKTLEDKRKEIEGLNSIVQEKTTEIEDALNKISGLEHRLEEQENEISNLRQTNNALEQKIQEMTQSSNEDSNSSSEAVSDETLDQIDLLKRRNEQLELDNVELKKEQDKLKGKLANKENTIKILDERIRELEKKVGIVSVVVKEEEITPKGDIHLPGVDNVKDDTKRTIDTVVDLETGKEVYANEFFSQSESAIFKMRTELQKAIYLRHPKFICKYCGQKVKISGRKTDRGRALFFSHLRDSDECDYKTTTGRTKKEIEREKYSKCNEGERHKKLKDLLATFLLRTSGVTNVRTENTMPGNHPILNWRRPDVAVSYRGQELIFELQLSSTFVSVIAERDLFYRLNKKFIIWVFNFDQEAEHVDITNMVVKDVYYNHRLNIFIFDKAAYDESIKRGELILKCNWIKPDGNWQYPNENNSNALGGTFVSLSDLTYSNDYKPYYYDAEKDYFAQHADFKQQTLSIEEENEKYIADLNRIQQDEEEAMQNLDIRVAELKDAFDIEEEIKHTQKYLIGRQDGKIGLVTIDGDIKIPFENESIESRRNWIEAKGSNTVTIYSRNNYEKINEGIKFESIGDGVYRLAKYVGDDILWGLIDKRGEDITKPLFSQIEIWQADKHLFLVTKDGKYGIINQQGIYVLNCKYDYIGFLGDDNLADITLNGKPGKIDRDCHFMEENSRRLGESFMKIQRMGNWGIEDIRTKRSVVPCQYDELASYRGNLLVISNSKMKILDISFGEDCPVNVKYVGKNERGMLIFKVGSKEALMNLRQQQKARKEGVSPEESKEMYVSFANIDRDLLYLSPLPINLPGKRQSNSPTFSIGEEHSGIAKISKDFGWIVELETGITVLLHKNMVPNEVYESISKDMQLKLRKKGYDEKHKKDIWEVIPNVNFTIIADNGF